MWHCSHHHPDAVAVAFCQPIIKFFHPFVRLLRSHIFVLCSQTYQKKGDVEVAARHNRLIILARDIFFYYFSSSNEESFTSTSFPLTFDLVPTAQEVEPLERAHMKGRRTREECRAEEHHQLILNSFIPSFSSHRFIIISFILPPSFT